MDVSATFLDRYGNTYRVRDRRLIHELQQFVGQPMTDGLVAQMETVVKNHIYRGWATSSGTADTTTVSNNIWGGWNYGTGGTATISIEAGSTSSHVWYEWENPGSITYGGTTTNNTWGTWVDNDLRQNPHAPVRYWVPAQALPPVPAETEEQRAQRLIREQQRRERWAAEEAARKAKLEAARIQAESLLDFVLSDIQRQSLKEEDWFLVVGKSGNIYRIRRGMVGNIDLVGPDGKIIRSYCVHPTENMPIADHMVAQKLWLESDDEFVEKTANKRVPYDSKVIDLAKHLPKAA